MRVLYLGLAVPNMNEYHNMFTDMMVEFKKQGHEIVVVGPTVNDDEVGLQIEDNIQVLRVPTMKLFGVGKFAKGVANILLPYQYKKALKKSGLDLNFELVMMPTPPITLASTASWLKKKYGSKFYLILRDIFPQNAVDLSMMAEGGMIFNYFRKKEIQMYKNADSIGCMSQGNIDFVVKQNPKMDASKLHLLPNWSRLLPLSSQEKIQNLKKQLELEDKFVVLFGGNIGRPQKMENIVALAKSCQDVKDMFFLIIGFGNEKENLKKRIASEGIGNIKLMDSLSRADYFDALQIAEVGLISLSEEFTIPNIPSKALVYYNTKKPILAAIDTNTDFGKILEDANCGLWAESNNTPLLKEKLLSLYNDDEKRKQMGENGYNYLKNELLTDMAYKTIIEKTS
jgi:glycosyltransferase involved in cell wall biosynthesis